jgi:hypothetical protein
MASIPLSVEISKRAILSSLYLSTCRERMEAKSIVESLERKGLSEKEIHDNLKDTLGPEAVRC